MAETQQAMPGMSGYLQAQPTRSTSGDALLPFIICPLWPSSHTVIHNSTGLARQLLTMSYTSYVLAGVMRCLPVIMGLEQGCWRVLTRGTT